MPRGRWLVIFDCDPERELANFLAAQPSWRRKRLQSDFSWTAKEITEWSQADCREDCAAREEYEKILRKLPEKWREYRKKRRQVAIATALSTIPPAKAGRPRKDSLAGEALALRKAGKSYSQIAVLINHKHGTVTTPDAIRKLLGSRRRGPAPDKT
jgi:hypothetical protein